METDEPPDLPLADVGRYPLLSEARERGLVVSAMELPHWVVRDGAEFSLRVEVPSEDAVRTELERYETERSERAEAVESAPLVKFSPHSLYLAGWLMAAFWVLQNVLPSEVQERGAAGSLQIVSGEWWRAITALTLHGDFSHFAANLAAGLLYAAFAVPRFGVGAAWLAIVLSGTFGNVLNAFFYRAQTHVSIGASTAVFGALGMLVGAEFIARLRRTKTRRRWQLIVPIGAGFGLLAFFGVGDEHTRTDYMAHLCGFICGLVLGGILDGCRMVERLGSWQQQIVAALAPILILLAWWRAW